MILDLNSDKYSGMSEEEATHFAAQQESIETAARSYLKREIRSYEISLWTLQDDFITVLKWSDSEQRGRIQEPKMKLDIDGTMELSFNIPMYIYVFQEKDRYSEDWLFNESRMVKRENPIWYNTQNGNLIASMRKLKVIFNKGTEDEGVFEFLITKVTESHEADQLICEIESEGLAFNELGKIGYKHTLNQDEYALYIEQLENLPENEGKTQNDLVEEYPCNIDFWMQHIDIEKYPDEEESSVNPRKWYYKVQMNWDSFAGTTQRDTNKIYEEPYASSWVIKSGENGTTVVPDNTVDYKEKLRCIDVSESNIYNITQELAEKFGVFCRYEYGYDDDYHIIERVIVFYNNFMKEDNTIAVTYPHKAKKISRQMDGTELTTKLFVRPIDDESTLRGTINIMNSGANKMKEDYLLNFDYLRTCGGINEEQYQAISEYETDMSIINNLLIPIQNQYGVLSLKKTELEADVAILKESIKLDDEQMQENSQLGLALSAKDGDSQGYITIGPDNPKVNLIKEVSDEEKDKFPGIKNYIDLSDDYKGIDAATIVPYSVRDSKTNSCSFPYEVFRVEYDTEYGFPKRIYNLERFASAAVDNSHLIFVSSGNTKTQYAWSSSGTTIPSTFSDEVSPVHNVQTLTDNQKSSARFLWTMTQYGYSHDHYEIRYDVIDKGDPGDVTFYDMWRKIYYYTSSSNPKPTFTASNYNSSEVSTGTNVWTNKIPNYIDDTYQLYSCWVKRKRKYISYTETYKDKKGKKKKRTKWKGPATTALEATTAVKDGLYDSLNTVKGKVYLTFKYNPQLYYDKVVAQWANKLAKDTAQFAEKMKVLGEDNELPSLKTGLYKTLYEFDQAINHYIAIKEQRIKQFEQMMGAALREGYWDADDYTNYGDLHEAIFNRLEVTAAALKSDTGTSAVLGWDSIYFDNEESSTYTYSIEETPRYYPCINLATLFGSTANAMSTISKWLKKAEELNSNSNGDDLSDSYQFQFIFSNTSYAPAVGFEGNNRVVRYAKTLGVGSEALLRFARVNNEIVPVLMLIGAESYSDDEINYMKVPYAESNVRGAYPQLGIFHIISGGSNDDTYYYYDPLIAWNSSNNTYTPYVVNITNNSPNCWIDRVTNHQLVDGNYTLFYPHIKISSLDLKTEELYLYAKTGNTQFPLTEYEDYSVLYRVDPFTVWTPYTKYEQNEVVYHNGLYYTCLVTNADASFTAAHWSNGEKIEPTHIGDLKLSTGVSFDNVVSKLNIIDTNGLCSGAQFISIKPEVFFKNNVWPGVIDNTQIKIDYYISNAATALYLDAQEVLKENYIPKVEYTVETNILDKSFMKTLYSRLAQIMMINDTELKFENVFGYISGIELNLDKPDEDSIEVKNYKTKFEDLFSTITVQTDAMKKTNNVIESIIAGKPIIQEVLEENTTQTVERALSASIEQGGLLADALTTLWDEAGAIVAAAQSSLDQVHTLNIKNANILSGFAERIYEATLPTVTRGTEMPSTFKQGDIFIETDEAGMEIGRYVGMVDSASGGTMTRTYDGSLSSLRGASMSIDVHTGTINILAKNNINIKSGSSVYIAANDTVDIVGNKAVNIGGARINLATLDSIGVQSGITMIAAAEKELAEGEPGGGYLNTDEETYILAHLTDLIEPYKDLVIDGTHEHLWDVPGFSARIEEILFQVKTPREGIENDPLVGHWCLYLDNDIIYDLGDEYGPDPYTSEWHERPLDEEVYNSIISEIGTLSKVCIYPRRIEMTSSNIVMKGSNMIQQISSDGNNTSAIQISADKGVWIGSTKGIQIYGGSGWSFDEDTNHLTAPDSGVSVEINSDHALFGASNGANATAIEIVPQQIILAAGNVINGTSNHTNGVMNTTHITENANISGVQIQNNYIGMAVTDDTHRTLISLKPDLILIGSSSNTSATEASVISGGSYVQIAPEGIDIGTSGHLTVNASSGKFKICSNATGTNDSLFIADANNWGDATTGIGYSNANGLRIKGNIQATSLFVGDANTSVMTYNSTDGLNIGNDTSKLIFKNNVLSLIGSKIECGNISLENDGILKIISTQNRTTGINFEYNQVTRYSLSFGTELYQVYSMSTETMVGWGSAVISTTDYFVIGGTTSVTGYYLKLGNNNTYIKISEQGMSFNLNVYSSTVNDKLVSIAPGFNFNQNINLGRGKRLVLSNAAGTEVAEIYLSNAGSLRCVRYGESSSGAYSYDGTPQKFELTNA